MRQRHTNTDTQRQGHIDTWIHRHTYTEFRMKYTDLVASLEPPNHAAASKTPEWAALLPGMKHRNTEIQTQWYKNRYTEFHMPPSNKLFLKPSNYAATFQPPAGVETQKHRHGPQPKWVLLSWENTVCLSRKRGKVTQTQVQRQIYNYRNVGFSKALT